MEAFHYSRSLKYSNKNDVENHFIFTEKAAFDEQTISTANICAWGATRNFNEFFFSIWVFFHEHLRIVGLRAFLYLLTTISTRFTDT